MSFQGNANPVFELYPLRFRPAARGNRDWTANTLRGAFGAALKRKNADTYARYFAPTAARGTAPSGFANPARPFVFRFGTEEIGLNLFTTREPAVELFVGVMGELGFELAAAPGLLRLPLAQPMIAISRVRVRFLTPTELGKAHAGRAFLPAAALLHGLPLDNARASRAEARLPPERAAPQGETFDFSPAFGTLARRVRDRISTLRALYGPGPLDIDFKAFGEKADAIRLTDFELQHVATERVSKGTGQRHSIGGFTGFAEYEGDLAAFVPYLKAARYTGVGRQTVWGKGEIVIEEI